MSSHGSPAQVPNQWVVRHRSAVLGVAGLVAAGAVAVATQLPARAATTVSVNGATSYQTIDGFGMSEAFGQAILRSIIPSTPADTIEPTAPAGPSSPPTYVWDPGNAATDEGQLWLARQAKGYGVSTFYNDAWSAPGFMKTNGSEANGGSLCGTPNASCASGDWRQAYANYLTQHAKNWASQGLTPAYVGAMNEPSLSTSYSSMQVDPSQAASLLSVLSPTLAASGLPTRAACCDTLGFDLLPGYVAAVGANAGLFTSHGYSSAPTAPVASGGRHVWETEWSVNGSTWNTNWDDGTDGAGLTWAQRIQTGLTGANLNAFLYFWGISATSHDSSLIGLSGSTLTPSRRYYALASFSRFIRPGAVRVAASSGDASLSVSAFRNTDGSLALVALNTASTATRASYSLANTGTATGTVSPYLTNTGNGTAAQPPLPLTGGAFTATVPARSLVTYRITAGTACTATATVDNSWPGGFQATVTVTNPSPNPITWSVTFPLPPGGSTSFGMIISVPPFAPAPVCAST